MAFSPASITVDRTSPVPLYYQVAQRLGGLHSARLVIESLAENFSPVTGSTSPPSSP